MFAQDLRNKTSQKGLVRPGVLSQTFNYKTLQSTTENEDRQNQGYTIPDSQYIMNKPFHEQVAFNKKNNLNRAN